MVPIRGVDLYRLSLWIVAHMAGVAGLAGGGITQRGRAAAVLCAISELVTPSLDRLIIKTCRQYSLPLPQSSSRFARRSRTTPVLSVHQTSQASRKPAWLGSGAACTAQQHGQHPGEP